MLAIRLQRTGRKGLAQYRVIVQESHKSPKSQRVVARLGHYNPHNKEFVVDAEQAETFMKNGAQPSDRVARLFKANKIKLPKWVVIDAPQNKTTKSPEKLRKNQPKEEKEEVKPEPAPAEAKPEEAPQEATKESKAEPVSEEDSKADVEPKTTEKE